MKSSRNSFLIVPDSNTHMEFLTLSKPHWAWRPILPAAGTYSHNPTKWLEEKLKSLILNKYTINNAFDFASELHNLSINDDDILVSYIIICFSRHQCADRGNHEHPNQQSPHRWLVQQDLLPKPSTESTRQFVWASHKKYTFPNQWPVIRTKWGSDSSSPEELLARTANASVVQKICGWHPRNNAEHRHCWRASCCIDCHTSQSNIYYHNVTYWESFLFGF